MFDFEGAKLRGEAVKELAQMSPDDRKAFGQSMADMLTYNTMAAFADIEDGSMDLTEGFLGSVVASALATYLKVHKVETGDLTNRAHEGAQVVQNILDHMYSEVEGYIVSQGWDKKSKVDPSLN